MGGGRWVWPVVAGGVSAAAAVVAALMAALMAVVMGNKIKDACERLRILTFSPRFVTLSRRRRRRRRRRQRSLLRSHAVGCFNIFLRGMSGTPKAFLLRQKNVIS